MTVRRDALADNLQGKADWLREHLRKQEWLDLGEDGGWFNSYYDDHGRRVEGVSESGVRMMLTGQVFAIMGGTATDGQIASITQSADRWLYRKELGGYRLNTDFHELKFDMGRMFGFAYGEKENGAASWYLLAMVTEVFGVRGELGDLVIAPKLLHEQFDETGKASIALRFGRKSLRVTVANLRGRDYGAYAIEKAFLTGADRSKLQRLAVEDGKAVLRRAELAALPEDRSEITVELM